MERDSPEEEREVAPTDNGAAEDSSVDHRGLAALVARAEPESSFSPPEVSMPARVSTSARKIKSPRTIGLVLGIAGLLLLIFGGSFLYLTTRSHKVAESNSQSPPRESQIRPPNNGSKAENIDVPGGTFQMGRANGPIQELPPHPVTVQSFAMDKTEVTNAEYAGFVSDTNHTPPSKWNGTSPPNGQELWPVSNVSLRDAEAFAAWRTKRDGLKYRLPTEEEWEYAARGGDQGNLFPWGNSWVAGKAATREASLQVVKPVGSYPEGAARWGHLDMIGNVWEWTSSKASYYPGSDVTVPPAFQNWVVIRGGSLASDPVGERAVTNSYRDWLEPTTKNDLLGFRLVRESNQ